MSRQIKRDDFWGDLANTLLLQPVYRKPAPEPDHGITEEDQIAGLLAVFESQRRITQAAALRDAAREANQRQMYVTAAWLHGKADRIERGEA